MLVSTVTHDNDSLTPPGSPNPNQHGRGLRENEESQLYSALIHSKQARLPSAPYPLPISPLFSSITYKRQQQRVSQPILLLFFIDT